MLLDPYNKHQLKKLEKRIDTKRQRSKHSSNEKSARSKGSDTQLDFIPFVRERSHMGRLLSLEDSRVRQSRLKTKNFDLSNQKITYLNNNFD